jgi:hypothetical protein
LTFSAQYGRIDLQNEREDKTMYHDDVFPNMPYPYDIWTDDDTTECECCHKRIPENDILYVEWLDGFYCMSCIEQWLNELMDWINKYQGQKIYRPVVDALQEQFDKIEVDVKRYYERNERE